MDDYQRTLYKVFEPFRPSPKYPTYPPYHEGDYLEDFFCKYYEKQESKFSMYFIPIHWTTCYVENCYQGIQNLLDNLDPSKKYFTVAQHDDAIRERLPPNTISFNAGGNGGGIPIPLICSPIPEIYKKNSVRDIFCSFVGSITHPIRVMMCNELVTNEKYVIQAKNHTPSVSSNDFLNFLNITNRSIFSLAPRGYGRSSFRLYEIMQLGSIPVFVYDHKWCPFEDEIDWSKFCVLIDVNNIKNIDKILSNYSPEKIKQMQDNMYKYWSNNFTLESVCKNIIDKI